MWRASDFMSLPWAVFALQLNMRAILFCVTCSVWFNQPPLLLPSRKLKRWALLGRFKFEPEVFADFMPLIGVATAINPR